MKPSPAIILRICFLLLMATVGYGLVNNLPNTWRPLVNDTTPVRSSDQALRFVIVAPQGGHPFWEEVRKGAQEAGDRLHINVEFNGARRASVEEQVRLLDMATAAQVDAIITQGVADDAVIDAVERAMNRGIHVITVDVDLPEHPAERRVAFVGSDSQEAAKKLADELVRRTGGKAVVGIIRGNLGPEAKDLRVQSLRAALKPYPDVKIVVVESSELNRSVAGEKALKILVEHPDVTAILGTTALDAVGAAQTVRRYGRSVLVMGWGDMAEAGDHLARGMIAAAIHEEPALMGRYAVELLDDYLRRDIRPPEFTPTPYYVRSPGGERQ